MGLLTPLDFAIFFGSLLAIMAIGLWAGRKEASSTDYYLAGKNTRWWGVAGSIFGSNISANHIVGMMGVGFTVGFVESHFELGAIAGLLLLCYGFLPVYRKLNVFTLSEYLSQRYNDPTRVAYTIIMVTIIVVIMMVPGFYIGSRSLNILLLDESQFPAAAAADGPAADAEVAAAVDAQPKKVTINRTSYIIGILLMAVVTGSYTIVGGLKAVIVTDVIQSLLMLLAAAVVAFLTFSQPEVGWWSGMRTMDAAAADMSKMHLYLPMNHPQRPWSGVLSGLFILHFYYWGTNQFIVQRALSARSDREARLGVITAGFFKLLIPFISIGTGVAAYYYFKKTMPGVPFDGDTAFPMLMRKVVAPVGYGVVGLVSVGLVGAILSSLDSMMNSAATLITFDLYQRYVKPDATEKELIRVGRIVVAACVIVAALLTIVIMDPNSKENFFNYVAGHQSKLIAGLFVAFGIGMAWPRATPWGGFTAVASGVAFSYLFEYGYNSTLGKNPAFEAVLGRELNFFHSVFLAAVCSAALSIVVSLLTKPDPEKSKLTWRGLGIFNEAQARFAVTALAGSLALFVVLAVFVIRRTIPPTGAGFIAGAWVWGLFLRAALTDLLQRDELLRSPISLVADDRFWGGLLGGIAVFMMFHFF